MKNDKNQNVQICKQKLWNLINNTLRNSEDTTIFKDYILPLLSFCYLSIKFEKDICKNTILGSLEKYKQAWDKWDSNEQSRFKNNIKGFCGFHIEPQYLWANLNNSINQDNFSFVAIDKALKSIESHCFKGLFENFDLTEKSKLGNEEEKNTKLKNLITGIDNIFSGNEFCEDAMGEIYMYLIETFVSDNITKKQKSGEFFTPPSVSELLSQIICHKTKNKNITKIYDPCCGSESLLLKIINHINNNKDFSGQKYKNDIPYYNLKIENGDTLLFPHQSHLEQKYNIIIANPPFGAPWYTNNKEKNKENCDKFYLKGKSIPKKRGGLAFLMHMLHLLEEDGTLGVILPSGVLCASTPGVIEFRKFLIENQYIDTIIQLPLNIFPYVSETTITYILIIQKCLENQKHQILFIDASEMHERIKSGISLRQLGKKNIKDIMEMVSQNKKNDKMSIANIEQI